MATYDMGFFIQHMRRDRGITQEQLCKGLCSVSTLSKIERGLYTPPGDLFRTLMERLGNYPGRYYSVFLDKNDFKVWQIRASIRKAIINCNIALAESLISRNADTQGFTDGLGLQSMLVCKVALAVLKEEKSIMFSGKTNESNYDEWHATMLKALRITIPEFDESKVSEYMLSYEELSGVLGLAGSYFFKKEYEKASRLLYDLMESMDKFCPDQLEKAKNYPLILSNLVENLYAWGRYEEAIAACALGWRYSVDYGMAREVPIFMCYYGKSLVEKGDVEEGKALLHQAYCVALSLGQKENAKSADYYYSNKFDEKLKNIYKFPE